MSAWDDLIANAQNTKLIQTAQQALQNWGYQQQQGNTGHTGNWGTKEYGITELFTPSKANAQVEENQSKENPEVLKQLDWNKNSDTSPVPNNSNGGNTGGNTGGVKLNDPYSSPGAGWFWDAADGWKMANGGDAAAEARRREEQARNEINLGYDQYLSKLGGLETGYGQQRDESLTSASKIYDQIFGGLADQKKTNMEKLAAGKTQVQDRTTSSIKDLQQNLSNVVRGMGMQLGAMGAGDTSASKVMMPYAYTKIAGQQEGSIRNQSNAQLFEIDQQERDTELQFTEMNRQTEIEKENQLQGIRDYYGDAIKNIQMAMANAPLDKAKDLASLSQSLLSEAMSNLRTVEARIDQRKNDIKTWATNRMSELNNAKLQLAGSANFSPRDIVYNELQMMNSPQVTGQANSTEYFNPLAAAKKIREEYLG